MRSHMDSVALQKRGLFATLSQTVYPETPAHCKNATLSQPASGMPPEGTAGDARKPAFQNGACWPIAPKRDTQAVRSGPAKMAACGPQEVGSPFSRRFRGNWAPVTGVAARGSPSGPATR
jgi:hypothetical protein